jgi:hypothetical protein
LSPPYACRWHAYYWSNAAATQMNLGNALAMLAERQKSAMKPNMTAFLA